MNKEKRNLTEEHREKISTARKGFRVSRKTRKKISESKKGRVPWNKGKGISDSHRQAISAANRGVPKSEEHRKAMSKGWARRRKNQKTKQVKNHE